MIVYTRVDPITKACFWQQNTGIITIYRGCEDLRTLQAYALDGRGRRDYFLTTIAPFQAHGFVLRTPLSGEQEIELRDGPEIVDRWRLCPNLVIETAALTEHADQSASAGFVDSLYLDKSAVSGEDPVRLFGQKASTVGAVHAGVPGAVSFEYGIPRCRRTREGVGPVNYGVSEHSAGPMSVELSFSRDGSGPPQALVQAEDLSRIEIWHFHYRERSWEPVSIPENAIQAGRLAVVLCFNDALYPRARTGVLPLRVVIRESGGYQPLANDRVAFSNDRALVAGALPDVALPSGLTGGARFDASGLDLDALDVESRARLAGRPQRLQLLRHFASGGPAPLLCTTPMVDCPLELLHVLLCCARRRPDMAEVNFVARFLAHPQLLQAAAAFHSVDQMLPQQATPVVTVSINDWLPVDLGASAIMPDISDLFRKVDAWECALRWELLATGMTAAQVKLCREQYRVSLTAAEVDRAVEMLEWLDQLAWTRLPARFQPGSLAQAQAKELEQRRLQRLSCPIDMSDLERLRDEMRASLHSLATALEDWSSGYPSGAGEPTAEQLTGIAARLRNGELRALAELEKLEAGLETRLREYGGGVAVLDQGSSTALSLGGLCEAQERLRAQEVALLLGQAAGWLRALVEEQLVVDWDQAPALADAAAWFQHLALRPPTSMPDVLPQSAWAPEAAGLETGLRKLQSLHAIPGMPEIVASLREHLGSFAKRAALQRIRQHPVDLAGLLTQRASFLSGNFRSRAEAIITDLRDPAQIDPVLTGFSQVLNDERLACEHWGRLIARLTPALRTRFALNDGVDPETWAAQYGEQVRTATAQKTVQLQALTAELTRLRALAIAADEYDLEQHLAHELAGTLYSDEQPMDDAELAPLPAPWHAHVEALRELARAELVHNVLTVHCGRAAAACAERAPAMIEQVCAQADAGVRERLRQRLDAFCANGDWAGLLELAGQECQTRRIKRLLSPYLDAPWVADMLPLLAHLCPSDDPFWNAQRRVLAQLQSARVEPTEVSISEADRACLGTEGDYLDRLLRHRDRLEGEWQKRLWLLQRSARTELAAALPDIQDLIALRNWWRQICQAAPADLPPELAGWRAYLAEHGLLPPSNIG